LQNNRRDAALKRRSTFNDHIPDFQLIRSSMMKRCGYEGAIDAITLATTFVILTTTGSAVR